MGSPFPSPPGGSAAARAAAALAIVAGLAALALFPARPGGGAPLWPGSRFTRPGRDRALQRGLVFLDSQARNPKIFREWGHDLVGAFQGIAATSRDPRLRRLAWSMGRRLAREWRRLHPSLPPGAGPNTTTVVLMGSDSAERLGVPAPELRREIREKAALYSSTDYYGYDVALEPPVADIPDAHCGRDLPRGTRLCPRCGKRVSMRTRWDVWLETLVSTWSGDRFGVTLGVNYPDALQWLPAMRPYPARGTVSEQEYIDAVYAVTHLVYTLNDYGVYRLDPACYPQEFAYLKDNLRHAIAMNDPETMGEYLDTLQSFGLTLEDPLIRAGVAFLLSVQNPDGSWGDASDPDPYNRYHPTWTAIDGLREYNWTRTLPCVAP